MNEIDMSKDDQLGVLRSTGKNGQKRNVSDPFGLYKHGWEFVAVTVDRGKWRKMRNDSEPVGSCK